MSSLQFAPFNSALDAGFWHKLSQLKLDVYGLDDQSRDIAAHYVNGNLGYFSFSCSDVLFSHHVIINFNH